MDVTDESMSIFRENKSYCSCEWTKGRELNCSCGESDQEPAWRWDENAKTPATILSHNCQQVYFHKGYSVGNACIRGDTPMVAGYDYYWEIKMLSTVYGTSMMIGIGTENFNINQSNEQFCNLLGSDSESWGMKFDGRLYHNNKSQEYNSLAGFTIGSIIGVHLNMWSGSLEFYLNRVPLGVAFHGLKNKVLYPMLSSTAAHSIMKLIFAHSEPYSLSLLSVKLLNFPSVGNLPPGLKNYNKTCWWLFPKSSRIKTDNNNKKHDSPSPFPGIYVFIDSDEEDENENTSSCNLLTRRMRRVLENSRHRNPVIRSEISEPRPYLDVSYSRPIRCNRYRTRPRIDY
ncbi:UNVERIFIED_CONTAM: hypothetical protein PYX00_005738 [Menopon gallinae]|uniref:B30.2/SPRY domain-containing protein n=1 Tax=Menopon gallinae TaxID=328185 RepID=A0AAW2HST5_9NEOP